MLLPSFPHRDLHRQAALGKTGEGVQWGAAAQSQCGAGVGTQRDAEEKAQSEAGEQAQLGNKLAGQ